MCGRYRMRKAGLAVADFEDRRSQLSKEFGWALEAGKEMDSSLEFVEGMQSC